MKIIIRDVEPYRAIRLYNQFLEEHEGGMGISKGIFYSPVNNVSDLVVVYRTKTDTIVIRKI